MVDYSKGTWMGAKVCGMMSEMPKMIVLKSTHRKNPQRFFVNKAVLRYYSTYFEKIFNVYWKEGRKGKTEFDVDIPQRVLRLFHSWLFTGNILTDFEPDVILKLYVYGDYIGCLALRRAVMTHLQKVSKNSGGGINIVGYQALEDNAIWTTHQNTCLYRFIVDTFAFHWRHTMDEPNPEDNDSSSRFIIPHDIPTKFTYDQLETKSKNEHAITRGIGFGDFRCCSSVCKYHEHLSDEERLATCGADFGETSELLGRYWDEDEVEMGGNEVEDNGVVNETINTGDNIEDAEVKVNGKRKVHDDGEEEEVSTKKHKQEEANP